MNDCEGSCQGFSGAIWGSALADSSPRSSQPRRMGAFVGTEADSCKLRVLLVNSPTLLKMAAPALSYTFAATCAMRDRIGQNVLATINKSEAESWKHPCLHFHSSILSLVIGCKPERLTLSGQKCQLWRLHSVSSRMSVFAWQMDIRIFHRGCGVLEGGRLRVWPPVRARLHACLVFGAQSIKACEPFFTGELLPVIEMMYMCMRTGNLSRKDIAVSMGCMLSDKKKTRSD